MSPTSSAPSWFGRARNATDPGAPQVVRLCESSWALDTGTACTTREALANATVTTAPSLLTFTCPAARDSVEVGGLDHHGGGQDGETVVA